jgi:hypothetical protein
MVNRVHFDTSTSGTANFGVGSAISTAYQTPSGAGVANGDTFSYVAYTATQFECARGSYNSTGPVITRTAGNVVAGSSGAGTLVNFSGSPRVFFGPLAEDWPVGRQCIPVPAAAMTANTTNGAAPGTIETTTNKVIAATLDFDATTSESVQFSIAMPDSWDKGTVTFKPIWSHPSTTTNFGVVFEMSARAFSNDDALDAAFGTGQTSTDTGGTTDRIYEGPESSAITIAGSPATGDLVIFKIARLPANASDTLAVDARLHAIKLFITTVAGHD